MRPRCSSHLKVAIILFLSSGCIPESHARHDLPSIPKSRGPRNVAQRNCSFFPRIHGPDGSHFPFDKANYLGYRVLGRYRDQHMNMVWQKMAFFYTAFLLLSQFTEYFPQVPSRCCIQHFSPALRYEHYVILALPPYMT